MVAPRLPAPKAFVAMVNHMGFETHAAGADIVIDCQGSLVHLLIPVPGLLATLRITLMPEQLGHLMADLVEALELVA